MHVEELARNYPRLFHMAAAGAVAFDHPEAISELAVIGGVPGIAAHVVTVQRERAA